eukprot:15038987-Ditylum_brightwellii.AAC.1
MKKNTTAARKSMLTQQQCINSFITLQKSLYDKDDKEISSNKTKYMDATENEKKVTMKQGAGESMTKQTTKLNFGTDFELNMEQREAATSKQEEDNNMPVNQEENTAYDKETEDVDNGLDTEWEEAIGAEEELRVDKQKAREQEMDHWTEDEETKKPSNSTNNK